MPKINVSKLHDELVAAGTEISGCDSNGVVLDINGDQIQDREDVKSVITAHDPAPDDEVILHEEYSKAGATPPAMIYALWKKVMASDSTDADALQSLMDGIDVAIKSLG